MTFALVFRWSVWWLYNGAVKVETGYGIYIYRWGKRNTKIRCSVVSCILGVLKNELIDWWRSGYIYILMVSRLLNCIRETVITFHINWVETALPSKYFICLRASTLLIPFTEFIAEFSDFWCRRAKHFSLKPFIFISLRAGLI